MNRPRVLLLSWWHVAMLSVLRALGSRFGRVTVLSLAPPDIVGLSRHVRRWHRFAADSPPEAILRQIRELVQADQIDLVAANDEGSVDFLARHGEALRPHVATTPVADIETIGRLRDKRSFMRLAEELGLPHPRTVPGPEKADAHAARAALRGLRYPVVVKPANLSCGFGVRRCDVEEEALAAIATLQAEGRPWLVQEHFEGHDLDFCLVAQAGRILRWTTRMNVGAKARFGAPGQDWRLERLPALLPHMQRLVACTNWSGALDVDCLYQPATGEWRALECNTRFGATTLADATAGVNLPEALVLAGLGRPVPPAECRPQRFYSGGWGVRQALGLGAPRFRFRETYLPYVVRDPLPELAAALRGRLRGR